MNALADRPEKPHWRSVVTPAVSEIRRLLPWIDASTLESRMSPETAAAQLRILLWRLRGMVDGAEALCSQARSDDERKRAADLAVSCTRAFSVCAESLRRLTAYGASATELLPTPEWRPPRRLRDRRSSRR